MSKKKEISEHIQQLLAQVADHFDQEDRSVRERQIRKLKKLKLYWDNISNTWYDEIAHDYRIYDSQSHGGQDMAYYDKPINVLRSYLESIIAALSVSIPAITCYPDDATNPLDLSTAKAGDKIGQLIYRHNDVILLWIHSLYIFCTEGAVACYTYTKSDKKYGTYEENKYEEYTEYKYLCPICKEELDESLFASQQQQSQEVGDSEDPEELIGEMKQFTNKVRDEFMPDDSDVKLQNSILNNNEIICPECAQELNSSMEKSPVIINRLVGITQVPKTRMCIESYGGLNIKIPNYARKQADMPYLRNSYETHYSNVIEMYPHLNEKARSGSQGLTGISDPYEAWGRLSPQYNGEYPINNSTVNNYWFRPSAFNVLDEDSAEELKTRFPNGCRYVKINECFAEAENESLDDCWTITHNPLSDHLQHDPIGLLLTSVQDITNELVSLIIQTIEHGIPQGFADPSVLNFDQYRQTEVAPGSIFPAQPKSGKSLSEFFYEIKTATLSQEVMPFGEQIQQFGQLVVGAQPALFGGELGGSKTASEYSQSRAQALQRLQTPWKMLTIWWKTIFGKVIPMYIKTVMEDEKSVEKDDKGNFINVYIRKAELQGKIGKIELEGAENLPMTWMQQKDVIMGLMQAGNPVLMEALLAPENLPFLKQAVGLPDFKIPGEADREKQFEEIQILINSEPIVIPTSPEEMQMAFEAGQQVQEEQEFPSVEVDPDVDNHKIESEICRGWLVSDAGRLAKIENTLGYKNVLLHMKMHIEIMQAKMMQEQEMAAGSIEQEQGKPQNAAGIAKKENEDSNGERSIVN